MAKSTGSKSSLAGGITSTPPPRLQGFKGAPVAARRIIQRGVLIIGTQEPPHGYYTRIEKVIKAIPLRFASWFIVALSVFFSVLGFMMARSEAQASGNALLYGFAAAMLALSAIEVILCAVLTITAAKARSNLLAHRLFVALVFLCPIHFFATQLMMYAEDGWPAFVFIASATLFALYLPGIFLITRKARRQLCKGHYQAKGYGYSGKAPSNRMLAWGAAVTAIAGGLGLPSTIATRRMARFLGNPFIGVAVLCIAPLLYYGFAMLTAHLLVACDGCKRFAQWPRLQG